MLTTVCLVVLFLWVCSIQTQLEPKKFKISYSVLDSYVVKRPVKGTLKSAGYDFFIPHCYGGDTLIKPGSSIMIPSGVKVKLPEGTALIALNKSSIAHHKKLCVAASLVDEDYQGMLYLSLFNFSAEPVRIEPGEKIVQFICVSIVNTELELLPEATLWGEEVTERGTGCLGSTNKKPAAS